MYPFYSLIMIISVATVCQNIANIKCKGQNIDQSFHGKMTKSLPSPTSRRNR